MQSEVKINFLPEEPLDDKEINQQKSSSESNNTSIKPIYRRKPQKGFFLRRWKTLAIIIIVTIFVGVVAFASSVIFSGKSLVENLSQLNVFSQVGQLITSQDKKLIGEDEDRINVLLMGIGGKGHDGGMLTDTMILGSYKPSTNQIAMMSIPRDMYVKVDGYGWMKINAINAYAEQRKEGSGGEVTTQALSKLLGIEIPYYITVDFDGFEKLIDQFGGVDVEVDKDLIDYSYPIRGREDAYPIESRFEKLVIRKGPHHFDGATALKYARSRHALGSEGSDFARSKRQQKILSAVKDKILSTGTLFNISKINSLLSAYNENIQTNLQIWEMLRIYQLGKNVDTNSALHLTLDDAAGGFLRSQIMNGAYVLLPVGGSYSKLKATWKNIFLGSSTPMIIDTGNDENFTAELEKLNQQSKKEPLISSTPTTTTTTSSSTTQIIDGAATSSSTTPQTEASTTLPVTPVKPAFTSEKAKIEIKNGTLITGWAGQEKVKLQTKGFVISGTGNAPTRDYKSIHIYDVSGSAPQSLAELQKIYGVSSSITLPAGLTSNADILIVLGK
ncbi:MAG: LCP family protein [Patescibacteria group bacterium]|jgi:LCP family protein required for cell wall assembly